MVVAKQRKLRLMGLWMEPEPVWIDIRSQTLFINKCKRSALILG